MNLQRLRDFAQELGYKSLFDVALAEAQCSPNERQRFMESGGLEELFGSFLASTKRKRVTLDIDNKRYGDEICGLLHEVYAHEWQQLLKDNNFKISLDKIPSQEVSLPDFSALYARMQAHAPQLFALIDALVPDRDSENAEPEVIDLTIDDTSTSSHSTNTARQKRERSVVVAISILAHQANNRVNILQCSVNHLLQAHKVPKKLMVILHQLGISSSYRRGGAIPKSTARTSLALREVRDNPVWNVNPSNAHNPDVEDDTTTTTSAAGTGASQHDMQPPTTSVINSIAPQNTSSIQFYAPIPSPTKPTPNIAPPITFRHQFPNVTRPLGPQQSRPILVNHEITDPSSPSSILAATSKLTTFPYGALQTHFAGISDK